MCVGILPILQGVASIAGMAGEVSANNAAHEQNRLAAIQSASDNYAANAYKTILQHQKDSQDLIMRQREAIQKRSSMENAAGEAGIALNSKSVDALEQDFLFSWGLTEVANKINTESTTAEARAQNTNTRNQTISRINSIPLKKLNPLAAVGTMLGAIGKGME